MKKLLFLCVILLISYFGYSKFFPSNSSIDTSPYSLSTVDEQPIPKRVFFELWKDVALQQCANAKEKNNLTPEQCREKVTERHTDCERLATTEAPEKISDKATSKELGRKFLTCVTPYFFCNGVEVSTEDEARKHCQ